MVILEANVALWRPTGVLQFAHVLAVQPNNYGSIS